MKKMNLTQFALIFLILVFNYCSVYAASPYELGDKLYPYSESDFFKNHEQLISIIAAHKVQTIVEIGCWFGESTICMAKQLPVNGKVYAIDSWIGYPKETYQITRNVYERFLSNVIHAGLMQVIKPIRMTSLTASRNFPKYIKKKKVDMIYLDGDHAYKAVYSDIKAWFPYLKKDGILCGNIYAKTEEEMAQIKKAVNDYCKDNKKSVSFDNYFWRIY